jgi:hypothetical protein
VLKFGSKAPKKLLAYQMYSHLYWSNIKPLIDQRWLEERDGDERYDPSKHKDKPAIWFQNEKTREMYEAESDEIKARVERHRNGEVSEAETDNDDDEDKRLREARARQT